MDSDSEIGWCNSCLNVIGTNVSNDSVVIDMKHEFCPKCMKEIITKYDKQRKTGHPLPEIPEQVEENVYHIFRVNISIDEWKVCDYCGRLWKDNDRIVLPIGLCRSCLKSPEKYTIVDWFKMVQKV